MDAAYSHLALPVTAFSIWHRDENGATDIRYAEEGDGKDNMATHVVASINICRGMLRQPRVKEAFVELARQYCQVAHGGWMDSQGSSSTTHVQGYANTFIEKILNTFPLVFVEYSLTNPDNMGYQPRRSWRPPFEPRNPSILINGKVSGRLA